MKKYVILCLLFLKGLFVIGQSGQAITINHSLSLADKEKQQWLSAADSTAFIQARQQNKPVVLILTLTHVPADLVSNLLMKTQKPDIIVDENGGTKTLIFRSLDWNPEEVEQLELSLKNKSTQEEPAKIIINAPLVPILPDKFDDKPYVLDACEDDPLVQRPNKRDWAYLKPGEQTRMVITNINPLRYSLSVDAATLAFNTDAAAVRSSVDAILGNTFKPASTGMDRISLSKVDELKELLKIGDQLSGKLVELRKKPCLTVDDVNRLNEFLKPYANELKKYPDEVWLDIALKRLAADVAIQAAQVGKAIPEAEKAPKSEKDFKDEQDLKNKLNDLANYGKREGIAKFIYSLFNLLKQVPDGRVLKTQWIKVNDHRNVDAIRFTVKTKSRLDTAAPAINQFYDVWIVGRAKFDFSAGLILSTLADETKAAVDQVVSQTSIVEGQPQINDVVRQRPIDERTDKVTMALVTMAHLSWRTSIAEGGFSYGIMLGGGITNKGRPLLLAGGSLLFGRQQRLVLSGGVAVGTQKELSARYDQTSNYFPSEQSAFTYIDRTRAKPFIGLTFNFGQNVKKETIISN